jgi:hypothetical protein
LEHDDDNSLYNVLSGMSPAGEIDNTWKGPGNVNIQMIAMYLNARFNGTLGLNYPAINPTTGRPFASKEAFADRLYELGLASPHALGDELAALIEANHAP